MCPEAGARRPCPVLGEKGVPGAAAPQLAPLLPESTQRDRALLLCSGKTQGSGKHRCQNPSVAREIDAWGLQRERRLELVKSHFRQTNRWSSVLVLVPKLSSKLSYDVVSEENEVKREKGDKAGGKGERCLLIGF